MTIPAHWPARARAALESLLSAIESHLPAPEALVVFGSLVTGGWREGISNINLAVVLGDTGVAELRRLGPVFRAARMQAGIAPLILERGEIERAADVFPLKFAHIKAHHHVIVGSDPFADLVIDLKRLRVRTEAELRNQLIRLRQAIMFAGDDGLAAARVLQSAAKPFAMELEALLFVMGHPVPLEADLAAVFTAATAHVPDLDRDFFDVLSGIATGARVESPTTLLGRLPEQLARAIAALRTTGVAT